jgi:phosphoribosyl-ATP pyrophosphohydrolase/phosphoribosyl-AMP cyclohydrolase
MIDFDIQELDWDKCNDLIPAIVQDDRTGQVLMLGFMNRDALEKTLRVGRVTFWSRTRSTLWTKGETSENVLELKSIRTDCDRDTLLVKAVPSGPVCHTGAQTCFEREKNWSGAEFLPHLERIIQQRRDQRPAGSYTSRLFNRGEAQIARKLGEEAVELVVSLHETPRRSVEESADLLYHLLVFLAARGLSLEDVLSELISRHAD